MADEVSTAAAPRCEIPSLYLCCGVRWDRTASIAAAAPPGDAHILTVDKRGSARGAAGAVLAGRPPRTPRHDYYEEIPRLGAAAVMVCHMWS
jgi:hypothetical protein